MKKLVDEISKFIELEIIDTAAFARECLAVWPASNSSKAVFDKLFPGEKAKNCIGFIDKDNAKIGSKLNGMNIYSSKQGLAKTKNVVVLSKAYSIPIVKDVWRCCKDATVFLHLQGDLFLKIRRQKFEAIGEELVYQIVHSQLSPELFFAKFHMLQDFVEICQEKDTSYRLSDSTRELIYEDFLEYSFSLDTGELFDPTDIVGSVLYVSVPAYWTFARESLHIRKKGFHTVLLTNDAVYADNKTLFFDRIINTKGNVFKLILYSVLSAPRLIQIRGWMTYYYLPAVICALAKSKTVVEFMDIPEFFCDRENYAYLFGEDVAHGDFESFPVIFSKADGLLLNHDGPEIEKLKRKYKRINNVIQFHNYVCDEFCTYRDVKLTRPFSIVYAGTVIPSYYPYPYFGDCQLLPLVKKLTSLGMRVIIYNNPFIELRDKHWDYLFEAKRNPLFEMNKGGPPEIVTKKMSKHHFGLLMYIYEGVVAGKEHIGGNLPTKMTLYLEAGLPVLVSEELEYLASIVAKNGIGLVVAREDINRLDQIVAQCDYDAIRQNVLKFRKSFNFEFMIETLQDFYQCL